MFSRQNSYVPLCFCQFVVFGDSNSDVGRSHASDLIYDFPSIGKSPWTHLFDADNPDVRRGFVIVFATFRPCIHSGTRNTLKSFVRSSFLNWSRLTACYLLTNYLRLSFVLCLTVFGIPRSLYLCRLYSLVFIISLLHLVAGLEPMPKFQTNEFRPSSPLRILSPFDVFRTTRSASSLHSLCFCQQRTSSVLAAPT